MKTCNFIARLSCSVILIACAAGCGGEFTGPDDGPVGNDAVEGAPGEPVGEASQEFTACTSQGSGGGGTWGDVISLCTSDGYMSVKKHDGGSFSSSGQMELRKSSGALVSTTWVSAGASSVWLGYKPSGCYYAKYYSGVGGTAYTATLCH
jgi:hypothetical protein